MIDRLIELLCESGVSFEYATPQEIADHLLSAGVIVPPCKVGDYIKRRGDAYLLLWRVDAIHYYREGQPTISATHNNVTMTTTFDGIGKVFTKEEAEKAMERREG